MVHDDDCGKPLDYEGYCPKCGFFPDTQSLALCGIEKSEIIDKLCKGYTFMGKHRQPIISIISIEDIK